MPVFAFTDSIAAKKHKVYLDRKRLEFNKKMLAPGTIANDFLTLQLANRLFGIARNRKNLFPFKECYFFFQYQQRGTFGQEQNISKGCTIQPEKK